MGTGGPDSPEKSQHIGFLSNTDPDPENHKATKPNSMFGHHWHASVPGGGGGVLSIFLHT